MGETAKLTKVQREFLESMRGRRQTVIEGYKPAQRLVELGLAKQLPVRLGNPSFELTDAGRAALPPTETPDA